MYSLNESRENIFQEIQSSAVAILDPQDGWLPTSTLPATAFLRSQFMVKRIIDIAGALVALIALSPLLLTVAVLVRTDSRGPVLFSQLRWGMNGRKIRVYKFRSMRTEMCDASGVAQTVKNDPRITKIGAILRRTNIDELPQLINVLKGDMSLVGPRCHAIGMLACGRLYEDLVPTYHKRHTVRPGITGLAQMRGLRGPTDRSDKARARIASDIYYVDNFSVWLDIKIIIGTVISEIRGGKGF
jgi:lipopolysaccharide/colanic/teichoic acid biosynthesis glycosyltransferase